MPWTLCSALALCVCPQDGGDPPKSTAPLPELVTLREHKGDSPGAGFGRGIAFLGDVNRDGIGDYALGAPRDPTRADTAGSVAVISGRNGALLYLHRGPDVGASFGHSIAGGDADGDGMADVVIGAPTASKNGQTPTGSVRILSGKDGRLLREIWGSYSGEGFGWAVAAIGDVDRDGGEDYAISSPYADRPARAGKEGERDAGRIEIHSGKKFKVIHTQWGEAAEDRFGWCVAPVGDVNVDGGVDLLVGAEGAVRGTERLGSVRLISGRNGDVLRSLTGSIDTYFGTAVCGLGDIDGDNVPDFAVGAWNGGVNAEARCGEVRVFSGRGGKLLRTLNGRHHLDHFGQALACPGDVDRDGVNDILIGAPSTESAGYTLLVSGRTFETLAESRFAGPGESCGSSLCSGDFEGDGYAEILVACGQRDTLAPTAGRVLLLTTKPATGK